MSDTFDFSEALELLKGGNRVTRRGWNGKGMWLEMQRPDAHSKMTLPYIFITITDGERVDRVAWLASQADLFGEDWAEVE